MFCNAMLRSLSPTTRATLYASLALLLASARADGQFVSRDAIDERQSESEVQTLVPPPAAERGLDTTTLPPRSYESRPSTGFEPFGINLFSGRFIGDREDGINPDYQVQPGDRLTLRIWGAATIDDQPTVDAQGNIFIPEVGPVRVAGVPNRNLTAVVTGAVRRVFASNVNVYVNLLGTNPVTVFVTGFVNNPGAYAGVSSDSVLFFLSRAAGVDPARGSYRDIVVKRGSRTLVRTDLYDFLLAGETSAVRFRDGDAIVVGPRGAVVAALGDVRNAYSFELPANEMDGSGVARLARPEAKATHVNLSGTRDGKPFTRYLSLAAFERSTLNDGDIVEFQADERQNTITVRVTGEYLGPSVYTVPENTTLSALLDHVPIDSEQTDYTNVSLRRESVAQRQKQALDDSLRRLEGVVFGASSQSDEEARIRSTEAQLVREYTARAAEFEPSGTLVVVDEGRFSDVRLEDGDVVRLPQVTNFVLVSGEVRIPQALVFEPGLAFEDYIERVGGLSDRADESQFLLVRRSGEVVTGRRLEVRAGDELIVLPEIPRKDLQFAATISQIVFQIALSAATVAGL